MSAHPRFCRQDAQWPPPAHWSPADAIACQQLNVSSEVALHKRTFPSTTSGVRGTGIDPAITKNDLGQTSFLFVLF